MKKRMSLFFVITIFALSFGTNAQDTIQQDVNATESESGKKIKKDTRGEEYRRSSLCLILIDEKAMPKRDTIVKAFLCTPIPEKYNDHNVGNRVFCTDDWQVTKEDLDAYNEAVKAAFELTQEEKLNNTKPKSVSGLASKSLVGAKTKPSTSAMVDTNDKDIYAVLGYRHLLEENVSKQLFDKWFMDSTGNFTMDLVRERGLYDASVLNVQTAKNSVQGMGILEDAGEELINNTFVVVSRYRYISKEELTAEIEAAANLVISQLSGMAKTIAQLGVAASKAAVGAGYYVRATSFLFQLKWNDDISNKFYSDLWDNHDQYQASDIFSLKYIGQESALANVKAGIFTSKGEGELIRIATVNATDAVLAKLETKYEVFRTKTPIIVDGDKILAYIGTKEGVESGSKFEILEQVVDEKTGRTSYKRKGTVSVVKNKIWDNRFMANEELALKGKEQTITATEFKGSTKGLYSGMLLRQIK